MTKDELKGEIDSFCQAERLNERVNKTVIDYKNCLMKFYDFLKDESILLSRELAVSYKDYLVSKLEKGEFAVTSINKYIIIFNKFMKFLGYENLKITQIRTQQKSSIENQISNQEHKRMLRKAKEMGKYEIYMIIKTFAQTAIRIDELKYFTVENIQKGPYIDVFNKGKERKIILIGDLHRELKKYCKDNKITEGYIFRSPDQKRRNDPTKMIHATTIWRNLKEIGGIARVNLEHIHPHGWRHLFSIEYLKLPGATIEELADILGHSKIETTRIYTRTSLYEKKKRMEQIKY